MQIRQLSSLSAIEKSLTMTMNNIFPFHSQGSAGIRIVEMQVPPVVQVGKTVHLACRFDLEGANLYSLNWWRGSEQFYQFSPSSPEPVIVYDSPGITVDVSPTQPNTLPPKLTLPPLNFVSPSFQVTLSSPSQSSFSSPSQPSSSLFISASARHPLLLSQLRHFHQRH